MSLEKHEILIIRACKDGKHLEEQVRRIRRIYKFTFLSAYESDTEEYFSLMVRVLLDITEKGKNRIPALRLLDAIHKTQEDIGYYEKAFRFVISHIRYTSPSELPEGFYSGVRWYRKGV